ncbi:hypothetical protein GCM10009069_29980 [Algimonas arctica]|uniref:Uncharacterized protein n=1 Tax=Algimonas arctica TaxID=1479486 RepID=A0A8J3G3W5_9PROT|nr:hypothetical protein [Algimonas arctica]GHB05573.1 hypothetical protein GCM10009069_29980 [Algimonas arctica]
MKNIWKLSLAAVLVMGVPSMANAAEQATGFANEKVVEHEASVLAEMFN